MAETQNKKSNAVTRIRSASQVICDLVGEINKLDANFIANDFSVGASDPITDANLIDENASITAAQLNAALVGLRAFATTYASGTGARSALERVR
jgi:hypothetical protein